MNEHDSLRIPILSDVLGFPVPRRKFLVGLYDPSSHWFSLLLTMAAGVLKDGLVVNIVTTATSTTQIRSQLERTIPNLKDLEAEKKFFLSDWYTWMTGAKSEEPISLDSLSLAKMSVDQSRFQRGQSPTYDLAVADNFSTFLKYNDERVFMQWFDKLVAGLKQFKGVREAFPQRDTIFEH